MAIRPFLAMTAAEMFGNAEIPEKVAWMACQFSSYGTGLTNLPASLPPDSMLILTDQTPVQGHDLRMIARQLGDCALKLGCCGVLLDFQRPENRQTAELVTLLANELPCPVGVSEMYAAAVDRPVFLPPVPPSVTLESYLAPWRDREIWLELALDGEVITLTEQGADTTPLLYPDQSKQGFAEECLHCHYHIDAAEDRIDFTLWRTREDLMGLVEEAEAQGVTAAVGLYQELRSFQHTT